MKDIERMKELHKIVKNHTYRVSERGATSYEKAIRALVDSFYEALKEEYSKTKTKIPFSFFHETMTNALALEYDLEFEERANSIKAVDHSIGIIHRYIETGRFDYFRTYYRGSGYAKHGRWTDYVFDKNLNRFRWHEKYKDEVIEDYEKTIKDYKGADREERIKEWKEELEYWKTL